LSLARFGGRYIIDEVISNEVIRKNLELALLYTSISNVWSAIFSYTCTILPVLISRDLAVSFLLSLSYPVTFYLSLAKTEALYRRKYITFIISVFLSFISGYLFALTIGGITYPLVFLIAFIIVLIVYSFNAFLVKKNAYRSVRRVIILPILLGMYAFLLASLIISLVLIRVNVYM
jgi:hypothetical protein